MKPLCWNCGNDILWPALERSGLTFCDTVCNRQFDMKTFIWGV